MITLGVYGTFDWDANKSLNEFNEPVWCHDSGATLFIDGKHICSISEERLTRIKNEGNFPINSILYCMKVGNISLEDVDLVCIPSMCVTIFYKKWYEGIIERMILDLCPNAKIEFISHHLSHAASAVFSCNFNDGSFLTLDGAGSTLFDSNLNPHQRESNCIGYFNKKKKIFRFFNGIAKTNEFGPFYHTLSHAIYCEKTLKDISMYDERYRETFSGKIMGLSAYGSSLEFKDRHKLYELSKDLFYSDFPYVSFKENLSEAFSFLNVDEKSYVLQKNFELALFDYVKELKEKSYLEDKICFSGGCFLNVLGNSVLKKSGFFEDIHIPPFTSDTGLHFGAACFALYKNDEPIQLPHNIALLGKDYSQEEIEDALEESSLYYEKYDSFEELCEFTALQLNDNKIIGWFQNRSEFGPRALGSRSLLMHPGPAENKDIINDRVKHREYWRPFAGIILEENLNEYFEEDYNSPYMLYSLTVREEKRKEIAAITHKDNTCRIQTVNDKINKEVNTLIEKFKEVSGIPVLLNTSFNDNGEPIVESPQDAVKSFKNMDIDYLVIGNFVVRK